MNKIETDCEKYLPEVQKYFSNENSSCHYGYMTAQSPSYATLKNASDEMKKKPTGAEKVLWELLRNDQLGYGIRRQHILDKFIVDFICLPRKLIIEVDGDIHDILRERDQERTYVLESLGYRVLRFTNNEVLSNSSLVTTIIKDYLNDLNKEAPSFGGGWGEALLSL